MNELLSNELLSLGVKSLLAALTMAFGIYGLGAQLRGDDGAVTRKGKAIRVGLVLTGSLSILVLVIDALARADAAARDADERTKTAEEQRSRYESLLASTLHTALSTRDAQLTILMRVQPRVLDKDHYIARLNLALGARTNCRPVKNANPVQRLSVGLDSAHREFKCPGYELLRDDRKKAGYVLRFNGRSRLLPNPVTEPNAYMSFLRLGLKFDFVDTQNEFDWTSGAPDDPKVRQEMREVNLDTPGGYLNSVASKAMLIADRLDDSFFEFDGRDLRILLATRSDDWLSEMGLPSMVDLLGKYMEVRLIPPACASTYDACKPMWDRNAESIRVEWLAIRFPHGRNVVAAEHLTDRPLLFGQVRKTARGFHAEFPMSLQEVPISADVATTSDYARHMHNLRATFMETAQ
jgi:hypothetical protein